MIAEEKAKELVDKFKPMLTQYGVSMSIARYGAKQCALIAVDEIINECDQVTQSNDCAPHYNFHYWQEVKNEINKL